MDCNNSRRRVSVAAFHLNASMRGGGGGGGGTFAHVARWLSSADTHWWLAEVALSRDQEVLARDACCSIAVGTEHVLWFSAGAGDVCCISGWRCKIAFSCCRFSI